MSKKKKYLTPIYIDKGILENPTTDMSWRNSVIAEARMERMPEIFEHYDIEKDHPEKWKHLAVKLLIEYDPAFKIVKAVGAPVKKTQEEQDRMYRYFISYKAQRQKRKKTMRVSDAEVCKALCNDQAFKEKFPAFAISRLKTEIGQIRNRRNELAAEIKKLKKIDIENHVGPLPQLPYKPSSYSKKLSEKYRG